MTGFTVTSPQQNGVASVAAPEGGEMVLVFSRDDTSEAETVELQWSESPEFFTIAFAVGEAEKTFTMKMADDFIHQGMDEYPFAWFIVHAGPGLTVLGRSDETRNFDQFTAYIIENDPVWANGSTPVYRFLNTESGQHFFTSNEAEKNQVLSYASFTLEGVGFQALLNGTADQPMVYRLLNQNTGVHLYTSSQDEVAQIQKTLGHWTLEGGAFKAAGQAEDGLQAVHRFYHTGLDTHFFTTDEQEVASIQTDLPHYNYEGIAFYVPDIVMA